MSVVQAWFTNESIRFRVRALKARFRDQSIEFGVIRRHLQPTDIACDIGANKGSFIYWLSSWCRNGRVIAFEQQGYGHTADVVDRPFSFEQSARRLETVCRVLKLDNVRVEAKAAYSRSGKQDLFVPRGHQPEASLNRKAASPIAA